MDETQAEPLFLQSVHVSVNMLEKALIDFVQRKRMDNSIEYGFAQVQWRQLSIIFCTTSDLVPTRDSLLFFGPNRETFINPGFPLREHLLFVNYVNATEMLYFLGDLSFNAYQSHLDLGFISLGELKRDGGLLYDECLPEEQFIGDARLFANFYKPHFANPDQCWLEYPTQKQMSVLNKLFDDVVFGIPREKPILNKKDENAKDPLFYEIIMQRLLCQKHRPLAFYCGCLMSALHTGFYTEFVKHEQARLFVLFELMFYNESKRLHFAQHWFGSAVKICAPRSQFQFYNPPAGFAITGTPSELDALYARHSLRYPRSPYPGLYFQASLINAPKLIDDPDLPVKNGTVSFTHYEMLAFLDPMVERAIQTQVDYFHKRNPEYSWLAKHVTPMLMHYEMGRAPLHVIEGFFRKANPKMDEATEIMPVLTAMRVRVGNWLNHTPSLLDRALRLLAGVDNAFNVIDRFTVWPRSRSTADMSSEFYRRNPELKDLHKEPTPATYQDLLEYAERCWPPCMQKLIADRTGANHMKYEHRIAVSAQLRRFGYSEAQGTAIWHLLFQETDVYQQVGEHNFLESPQGSTIGHDYKLGREQNTGVSCRNGIGKGFCPFVDIEDIKRGCDCKEKNGAQFQCNCRELACQSLCKVKFAMQNPNYSLAFGVKSPRDYFFQARAALGPALYRRQ